MNKKTHRTNVLNKFKRVRKFSEFDKNELFGDIAEELAIVFAKSKIKRTQFRSFYDAVIEIDTIISSKTTKIKKNENLRLQLLLLKAKAHYKKEQRHVSKEFIQFIDLLPAKIKDLKDFEIFKSFFEALYAYFYEKARS